MYKTKTLDRKLFSAMQCIASMCNFYRLKILCLGAFYFLLYFCWHVNLQVSSTLQRRKHTPNVFHLADIFFGRFWRIAAFAESSTLLDAID